MATLWPSFEQGDGDMHGNGGLTHPPFSMVADDDHANARRTDDDPRTTACSIVPLENLAIERYQLALIRAISAIVRRFSLKLASKLPPDFQRR